MRRRSGVLFRSDHEQYLFLMIYCNKTHGNDVEIRRCTVQKVHENVLSARFRNRNRALKPIAMDGKSGIIQTKDRRCAR